MSERRRLLKRAIPEADYLVKWEVTRYYDYPADEKIHDRRFEIRLELWFPASWSEEDVAAYLESNVDKEIDTRFENALEQVFPRVLSSKKQFDYRAQLINVMINQADTGWATTPTTTGLDQRMTVEDVAEEMLERRDEAAIQREIMGTYPEEFAGLRIPKTIFPEWRSRRAKLGATVREARKFRRKHTDISASRRVPYLLIDKIPYYGWKANQKRGYIDSSLDWFIPT